MYILSTSFYIQTLHRLLYIHAFYDNIAFSNRDSYPICFNVERPKLRCDRSFLTETEPLGRYTFQIENSNCDFTHLM